MSTSLIEQTNRRRMDLHNWLLDDQNELHGKIQQLIKNYGNDSADRRLPEGYYAGRLEQLRELWQLSEHRVNCGVSFDLISCWDLDVG